jgi:hypothetical protein
VSSSDRRLIPTCTCGKEMSLSVPKLAPSKDATHVRTYCCEDCGREMRIVIWGTDVNEAYTPHVPLLRSENPPIL